MDLIPNGVTGIFHSIFSFRLHYGPGVDPASNRRVTGISLGV